MDAPKHIGIIMDGNRRFSKKLMMKPWKGHEWGARKIENILDWCKEYNVRELTLYTFSMQNFNRPKEEFDYLMELFRENFGKLKDDKRIDDNGIRINVIGRIDLFPDDVKNNIREIMERTKNNKEYRINFAMAYGGREELVDATKKIAEQIKSGALDVNDINEHIISENLYMSSEPDLIIRTGGMHRTSNFLPFQSVYSEYVFVDKMWPDFEKEDFMAALEDYDQRHRRFGK